MMDGIMVTGAATVPMMAARHGPRPVRTWSTLAIATSSTNDDYAGGSRTWTVTAAPPRFRRRLNSGSCCSATGPGVSFSCSPCAGVVPAKPTPTTEL
jgi:hypothetical protein